MYARHHAALIALALISVPTSAFCQKIKRELVVKNNGHKLHLTSYSGSGKPAHSSLTVVFESRLGGGEENWRPVIDQLPEDVQAITYGGPGFDGSEADGVTPSPEHIATVLHTALSQLTTPPYLLVGHSWGGPLIRAFAGMFPKEISGLVFVDPTDFNETAAGRKQYVFGPLNHTEDSEAIRAAIDRYYAEQAGHFEPAVQAEIDESRRSRTSDFAKLKTLPMPQVPLVILATTRYPFQVDKNLPAPFDQVMYQNLTLHYRLLSLSLFSRSVPEGTLATTADSGHYIQRDEPALVSWAIDRVIHASPREQR